MSAVIPVPPSLNNAYATVAGRRRVKTSPAKRWADTAITLLRQSLKAVDGPYAVRIEAAVNRRRDIDNVAKLILDALVRGGLTSDDRYCDELIIRRVPACEDVPAGTARITTSKRPFQALRRAA